MHCCCCVNVGGAQVETNQDVSVWADVVLGRVGGGSELLRRAAVFARRKLVRGGEIGVGCSRGSGEDG